MSRTDGQASAERSAGGRPWAASFGKKIETIDFYCFYFRLISAKPNYGEERFLGERRPK